MYTPLYGGFRRNAQGEEMQIEILNTPSASLMKILDPPLYLGARSVLGPYLAYLKKPQLIK